MKKIRKIVCLSILISVILLCFSSCGSLHLDEEKCGEVALDYMINKYGKEFILIYSNEVMRISGSAGYAEVEVQNPEDEKSYWISVYPDGKSDKDKDGFYDSYKVVSDDYMCTLVEDYVTDDMSELLSDAGLNEFVCSVSIRSIGFVGVIGIVSDFPIPTQETFSLKNVLQNYKMSTYCWLFIPESENSGMIQENIESVIKPLTLKGYIKFDINICSNEDYAQIKQADDIEETANKIVEKEYISFTIKNKQED